MKKGILFLFFLFPNKGIIATEANVKIHIPIIYATDDNYVMPTIVSMCCKIDEGVFFLRIHNTSP